MPRRPKVDPDWKPSIPNPRFFQLPNTVPRVSISIRPPSASGSPTAPLSPTNKQSVAQAPRKHDDHVKPKEFAATQEYSPIKAEEVSSNGNTITTNSPNGISVDPAGSASAKAMTWQPDIHVRSFVPRAYLEVNSAPAIPIVSQGVEDIDYTCYTFGFASPLFLPPRKVYEQLPSISGLPMLLIDQLNPENYGRHFMDSVILDLDAQRPEVRSYDLFGVRLDFIDRNHQMYRLHVPGLRENAPKVAYGNTVLLRQLLIDHQTKLPRGVDQWLSRGGRERGEPCPGFTGHEISATVHAVDRKIECLYLRIDGVGSLPIVCNVSFIVQSHRVHCLQNTILNIADEMALPLVSPKDSGPENGRMDSLAIKDEMTYWLRKMLFPELGDGIVQSGLPSGTFKQKWYDKSLNYEQMKAVAAIQSRDYGSICYLINGPPGTGKTKSTVEAVTQLANDPGFSGSILVCAPSDQAADTLALRLKAYFDPAAMFRLNEFSRTFAEVPQELLPYCYIEKNIFSLPPFSVLMALKVVVTTCQGAEMLVKSRLTNRDLGSLVSNTLATIYPMQSPQNVHLHWTALFVDEAAQATEPEVLIPLSAVTPKAGTSNDPGPIFVMAGDQFQLGPRVYDRAQTTLHISLFERLSKRPIYASHVTARRNRSLKAVRSKVLIPPFVDLIRNYRSHPAILAVPSAAFYHNSLVPEATQTESLLSWGGWQGRGWPVLFSCNGGVDDCENVLSGGAGWYNSREANKAIDYAQDLLKSQPLTAADICIMSPFRSQVNILRQITRSRGLWELNIGPMEAFQGLESRVVIICTTRSRSRFLAEDALRGVGMINEPRKFNVALTRAKHGLIILGNPWVLSIDPHWMAFLKFCWRNGLWDPDNEPRDPRMSEGDEGDVGKWAPPSGDDEEIECGKIVDVGDAIQGLEAALIYKEMEQHNTGIRTSIRRFMGTSQDDEMWTKGVEAIEALRMTGEDGDFED